MPTATYRVLVDWDNDGVLEEIVFLAPWFVVQGGDLEDVTSYVRSEPGIRTVRGRDQIRSLAPPMAGRCDMELNNVDKQFSPENTSSLLYGNLLPGREVQVQATSGGTNYKLWTGFLDDIPQFPELSKRTVGLPCLGPLTKLAGQTISTQLYSSITTGTAVGYVLDAAGWPAGDRVIDSGNTTFDWWWLENEDAITALNTILASEGPGACIYEDGQGRIVFEGRGYRRTTTRSNTSQATFRDTGAEPKISMQGFSYNPQLKSVYNSAVTTVKSRSAKATGVVWSLGSTLTLAANEVRKIVASATDPFQSAITPASGTDYTVSAGSVSTVTLSRTSGQSTVITITAGASGATITGLQLRADSVSVDNTTQVASTLDSSTSITKYGTRVYSPSIRAEIPLNTAQDLLNAVVALYQEPRATVQIRISNGHADRLTQILTREISDRITIVEAQTGLDADFYIEQVSHEISQAGLIHHTTFGCEKVSDLTYAVWGVSLWGTGRWGW